MGMASTGLSTVFYTRGEGAERDTAHVSRTYKQNDCTQLAVAAWFGVASGAIDKQYLRLPAVDDTWHLRQQAKFPGSDSVIGTVTV